MPGHNHKPTCGCGWCYKPTQYRSIETPSLRMGRIEANKMRSLNFRKLTYQSFVRPNAYCPHCKRKIFFFRSPFGGCKYFDALGPPWPKHACLDTALLKKNFGDEKTGWLWQRDRWQPFVCLAATDDQSGITVIRGYFALTRKPLTISGSNVPEGILKTAVVIREGQEKDAYECSCPLGKFHARAAKAFKRTVKILYERKSD